MNTGQAAVTWLNGPIGIDHGGDGLLKPNVWPAGVWVRGSWRRANLERHPHPDLHWSRWAGERRYQLLMRSHAHRWCNGHPTL